MTRMSRTARLAALALPFVGAVLSACGGGGGGDAGGATDGTSAATPVVLGAAASAPAGTAPAASAPAPATPATAEPTCGSTEFKARMLAAVNAYRATARNCGTRGSFAAAAALAWNDKLEASSLGHSQDMVTNNFFSHTSADGRTLVQRVEAQAYDWSRLAENIAAGQTSIDEVMAGWIESDGHCANIMAPLTTEIGVACVAGTPTTTWVRYWTMDLGAPR